MMQLRLALGLSRLHTDYRHELPNPGLSGLFLYM